MYLLCLSNSPCLVVLLFYLSQNDEKMSFKKIFLTVFIAYLLLFPVYLLSIYLYDPSHIFRNPDNLFAKSMRLQARAYLNENQNVSGIVIGSSMLENTSSVEASKKLFPDTDNLFLNLSLEGSSFVERKLVLNYAFASHDIKKVIYSIDLAPLHFAPKTNDDWQKLYDSNPFNDFLIYLRKEPLQCLLTLSKSKTCIGSNVGLDRPTAWIIDPKYANSFNGPCSWPIKSKILLKDSLYNYQKSMVINSYNLSYQIKYTEDNVFSLTDKYKKTEFYFVVPPYSALYYKIKFSFAKDEYYWSRSYLKYFVSECDKRSNCHLYGFDDQAFVSDLKNYKDPMHYSDKINSLIIDSIAIQENEINSNDLNDYLEKSESIVENFDIEKVKKELSSCVD